MTPYARLLLGALFALAGPGSPACAPAVHDVVLPEPPPPPAFVVSSPVDAERHLVTLPRLAGVDPTAEIVLHPRRTRQRWYGVGAALTDASVQLLADRPGLVRALYGPESPRGARLNMLRLPLSATDFSPRMWTWPAPEARAAVRLVRQRIQPLRPDLRVVGAPWSAPGWMKTSGTIRGGSLADEHVDEYGDKLVDQARWLADRDVPLWATSLGNEPGHSSDYPSMLISDQQLIDLADRVGPELDRLGTRLWAVDHNFDDQDRVAAVTAGSAAYDGAAYHCYAGQPAQMAAVPDLPRVITECTGTTDGAPGTFAWDARVLVADAVAAGSSGLLMWNLALDPGHGPVDTGSQWGCKLCRGVITVTPDGFVREPEFYTLAHLARAASPGARVIDVDAPPTLSVAAFRNPDGTVGVFGHNRSGAVQTVSIAVGGVTRTYSVGVGELFSFRAPLSQT